MWLRTVVFLLCSTAFACQSLNSNIKLSDGERLGVMSMLHFAKMSYSDYTKPCVIPGAVKEVVPGGSKPTICHVLEGSMVLVVGRAGTEGISDWKSNALECDGHASLLGKSNLRVHGGMFTEAAAAYDKIEPKLLEYARAGYTIAFPEHSRAGTVGAYMMCLFADRHPEFKSQLRYFSFGSATAGDKHLAEAFNNVFKGQAFAFISPGDIVPQLGLDGFIPMGEVVELPVSPFVSMNPHRIGAYGNNSLYQYGTQGEEDGFLHLAGLLLIEGGLPQELKDCLGPEAIAKIEGMVADSVRELPQRIPTAPESPPEEVTLMSRAMDQAIHEGLDAMKLELAIDVLELALNDPKAFKRSIKNLIRGKLDEKAQEIFKDVALAGAKTAITSALATVVIEKLKPEACKAAIEAAGRAATQSVSDAVSSASAVAQYHNDRIVGRGVGLVVDLAFTMAQGEFKQIGQKAVWGGVSIVADKALTMLSDDPKGMPVQIGPSRDVCTKGLGIGDKKVDYLEVRSAVNIMKPIAGPLVTAGIALDTKITFHYHQKISGVAVNASYKARCPIGAAVSVAGIAKAAVYFGNGKAKGEGQKLYNNGDIKIVQLQRVVEAGAMLFAKIGTFGGLYTKGLVRDVTRRQWVRHFKEPINYQSGLDCKQLANSGAHATGASEDHTSAVDQVMQQLGVQLGRSQATTAESKEHENKHKGVDAYGHKVVEKFRIDNWHEEGVSQLEHEKLEDGTEITKFVLNSSSGKDTYKTGEKSVRRFLFWRYDNKHDSDMEKFRGRAVLEQHKSAFTIITSPDGTFSAIRERIGAGTTKTAAYTYEVGEKPSYGNVKDGDKFRLFCYNILTDLSAVTTIDGNRHDDLSGLLFTTIVEPKKVEETVKVYKVDSLIMRSSKPDMIRKTLPTELKTDHELSRKIITDSVTTTKIGHRPDFSPIYTFIRRIEGTRTHLLAQIQIVVTGENRLDGSASVEKVACQGQFSQDLAAPVVTPVLNAEGGRGHVHQGQMTEISNIILKAAVGEFTADGELNAKGIVEPTKNIKLEVQHCTETNIVRRTGVNGGSLVSSQAPSQVPSWAAGDALRKQLDSNSALSESLGDGAKVTVPHIDTAKPTKYTSAAPGVEAKTSETSEYRTLNQDIKTPDGSATKLASFTEDGIVTDGVEQRYTAYYSLSYMVKDGKDEWEHQKTTDLDIKKEIFKVRHAENEAYRQKAAFSGAEMATGFGEGLLQAENGRVIQGDLGEGENSLKLFDNERTLVKGDGTETNTRNISVQLFANSQTSTSETLHTGGYLKGSSSTLKGDLFNYNQGADSVNNVLNVEGSSFQRTPMGLAQEITGETNSWHTTTKYTVLEIIKPSDGGPAYQLDRREEHRVNAPLSAMASGGASGAAVQLIYRGMYLPYYHPDDPRAFSSAREVVSYAGKNCGSCLTKGTQALLSHSADGKTAVGKLALYCASRFWLDERTEGVGKWDIAECSFNVAMDYGLRTYTAGLPYFAMQLASCLTKTTRFGAERAGNLIAERSAAGEWCRRDKRICPKGKDCPWNVSADQAKEAFIQSGSGITLGAIAFWTGKTVGSFYLGPWAGDLCGAILSGIVGSLGPQAITHGTREYLSDRILLSERAILAEQFKAFQEFRREMLRQGLLKYSGLELAAVKEVSDIRRAGLRYLHVLHTDKQSTKIWAKIDEKLKMDPTYASASESEKQRVRQELYELETRENATAFIDAHQELELFIKVYKELQDGSAGKLVGDAPQPLTNGAESPAETKKPRGFSAFEFMHGANFVKAKAKSIWTGVLALTSLLAQSYASELKEAYLSQGAGNPYNTSELVAAFNAHVDDIDACHRVAGFLRARPQYDSFGLPTLERYLLKAALKIASKGAVAPLALEDDRKAWEAAIDARIDKMAASTTDSTLVLFPGVQMQPALCLTSTVGAADPKVIRWMLLDLLMFSPIPGCTALRNLPAARDRGRLEVFRKFKSPSKVRLPRYYPSADSIKRSDEPALVSIKKTPLETALPLSLLSGDLELFGYIQAGFTKEFESGNDFSKDLDRVMHLRRTPSHTFRDLSTGQWYRIDALSRQRLILPDGWDMTRKVAVSGCVHALYLPKSYSSTAGGTQVSEGLVGLKNLGVTCYLNSLLQAGHEFAEIRSAFPYIYTSTFRRVPSDASLLLGLLDIPSPHIQQDVHEVFLRLGQLSPEFQRTFEFRMKTERGRPAVNGAKASEAPSVTESLKTCLVVQPEGNDLVRAIEKVLSVEKLESCLERWSFFTTLPATLAILVQRTAFSGYRYKCTRSLAFPHELTLTTESKHSVTYSLRAVIVHVGLVSLDAGHYFAVVFSEQSATGWMAIDDERVYPVRLEDYYGGEASAYMLFYGQID